jgi:hypothetical protein
MVTIVPCRWRSEMRPCTCGWHAMLTGLNGVACLGHSDVQMASRTGR